MVSDSDWGRAQDTGISLIRETRKDFCSYFDEDVQGAHNLRQTAKRLRKHTEEIAASIDREFQATRTISDEERDAWHDKMNQHSALAQKLKEPDSKSTTLDESIRLHSVLKRAMSEDESQRIQEIIPDHVPTEERDWRIRSERSETASLIAGRPQREGHDLLFPFQSPSQRLCVSIPSWGFNCGLEYLPAAMTVEQALSYVQCYAGDLDRAAYTYGNTHALLYFRTLMAEMVLREFDMYGKAEEWTRKHVEEKTEPKASKVGRRPKMKPGQTVKSRLKAIKSLLEDEDYWHQKGRWRGAPKWKKIVLQMSDSHPELVKGNAKSHPEDSKIAISAERISQQVKESEIDLDSIRAELDIPTPK
jgi:hypothetical protein